MKNQKKCIVCGRLFDSPPSDKKVTCSHECRKKYAKVRSSGRRISDESRKKMSSAAKGRDMGNLQKIGTEAALKSPNSGRFESNINAIEWHLISPEGKHYHFRSLNFWLRENCQELFGAAPDSREFRNVRSGISGAKRAAMGKNYSCSTYRGWRAVPTEEDLIKISKTKMS